ncbi:hypothetical protein [Microbacterium sp. MPKO10]|uniref:hypothetical protein n=1 Tax=Microbacterium sp. MPKO10 TaxID=2989818 RepID=UPI0022368635|nr:hypothetical protein [Microbacterium sp. MPKO10]MCW4456913.1 hypothetical protein [Microbacterium sp. MPKO10]
MSTVGHVDLRPLTQARPSSAAVRVFRSHVRQGLFGDDAKAPTVSTLGVVVASILFSLEFVASAVFIVGGIVGSSGDSLVLGIGLASGFLVGVPLYITHVRNTSRVWKTWFVLAAFARANGWGTQPHTSAPNYPGMPFHTGYRRRVFARVYRNEPRFFDVAHLAYFTNYGKSRKEHTWTYLALKLDRRIPHLVVDGLSNNGILGSNLPEAVAHNQVLSLEGDFDKYFTLYCPRGYERDALTIFTPDLMALLIDNVEAFDVEIIDDWLFVYSSRLLPLDDPQTWMRLLRIVDTVGAKTVSQTARYRDDRLVPVNTPPLQRMASTHNFVAPPGQRLRTGRHWKLTVAVTLGFTLLFAIFAAIVVNGG